MFYSGMKRRAMGLTQSLASSGGGGPRDHFDVSIVTIGCDDYDI